MKNRYLTNCYKEQDRAFTSCTFDNIYRNVVKTKSIQPRHFTLTDKNFTVVVQSASGYDSDATYAYYRNNFRFRLREGVCEIFQDMPTLAISDRIMTPDTPL